MKYYCIDKFGKDSEYLGARNVPEGYESLLHDMLKRPKIVEAKQTDVVYDRDKAGKPANFLRTEFGSPLWSQSVIEILQSFRPSGIQIIPCLIVSEKNNKLQSDAHSLIYNRNIVNILDMRQSRYQLDEDYKAPVFDSISKFVQNGNAAGKNNVLLEVPGLYRAFFAREDFIEALLKAEFTDFCYYDPDTDPECMDTPIYLEKKGKKVILQRGY